MSIATYRVIPSVQVGQIVRFRPRDESTMLISRSESLTSSGLFFVREHRLRGPVTVGSICSMVEMMNIILETSGLLLVYIGACDLVGRASHPSSQTLLARKDELVGPQHFFRELIFRVEKWNPS